MPHLIIDYSSNVAEHHDVGGLLDAVHHAVLELDVAPVAGIRIRAVEHENTRIADGSDPNDAFVAMVARLGPGRDASTKMRLIEAVLDAAQARLRDEGSPLHVAWSCEVQEIDATFRVNRNEIAERLKRRDEMDGVN